MYRGALETETAVIRNKDHQIVEQETVTQMHQGIAGFSYVVEIGKQCKKVSGKRNDHREQNIEKTGSGLLKEFFPL